MRSRFGTGIDLAPAALADIRRASDELREKARSFPAPCGCTPRIRCDRHCRARIEYRLQPGGYWLWVATCNGGCNTERITCPPAIGLASLHDSAVEHVRQHRTAHRGGTDA